MRIGYLGPEGTYSHQALLDAAVDGHEAVGLATLYDTVMAVQDGDVDAALVRYDAYNEMSGHQSLSIALLDANRSGIVLSSIHHRDQARVYAKQIHGGTPDLRLSPEEEEALRIALGDGR